MARRTTFHSTLDALVHEKIRKAKEAEMQQKALKRTQIKIERDTERTRKLKMADEKRRYLELQQLEAEDLTGELEEKISGLKTILEHTLGVNDVLSFDSLRNHDKYVIKPVPLSLTEIRNPPVADEYHAKVKPRTFLEKATGNKRRYEQQVQSAEEDYQAALRNHEAAEEKRIKALEDYLAKEAEERKEFESVIARQNQAVDEFETKYRGGDIEATILYNKMVLERSQYPAGFSQVFRLAYLPEARELVVEYELPTVDIVPQEVDFRYNKSKDTIDAKQRKAAEIRKLYQDVVSAVTLRTVHEIFEADQGSVIDVVVFNGFVDAVDPAIGKDIRPCLISVRATKQAFMDINLARIEKRTCLRNLGAQVSPQPQALQPVKPIIEFDMVDKRFVEQSDVLSDLETRPNLMDLNPYEFETLVGNLFQKMGLETRLTRSSRDGGVDVVAFDTRPVLGGKVVIQAKRYRNTVGISAVRDLYGTMLNEGANKGIIVSTSSYGSDAYDFAKDKPIEMIDGGGLLYLLDQVGTKARIVMPVEGRQ